MGMGNHESIRALIVQQHDEDAKSDTGTRIIELDIQLLNLMLLHYWNAVE